MNISHAIQIVACLAFNVRIRFLQLLLRHCQWGAVYGIDLSFLYSGVGAAGVGIGVGVGVGERDGIDLAGEGRENDCKEGGENVHCIECTVMLCNCARVQGCKSQFISWKILAEGG